MSFGLRFEIDDIPRSGGTKWYVKCLTEFSSNIDLLAIQLVVRRLILLPEAAFFERRL